MTTWYIKGMCENCGFAFKGPLSSKEIYFPALKCPQCHKETENFDEAFYVDELNEENEHPPIEYIESVFETVSEA